MKDLIITSKLVQDHEFIYPFYRLKEEVVDFDVIKNKKVTSYYVWKKDVENSGGIFVDNPSVHDHNLIKSPHYKFNRDWMKLVVKKIKR